MTLEEFVDEFSGSPVPLEELADLVCTRLDRDEAWSAIWWAATKYREARKEFLREVEIAEIELG